MKRTPVPPEARGPSLDAASFREDVLRGLRRPAKELPCKYYDERGSRLFEAICDLEEYYLTRTELTIMRRHAAEMADRLGRDCLLIEFGSGSSLKTRLLLDHLHQPAAYVPVDISGTHLERSAQALAAEYPHLEVLPVCADFTGPLDLPSPTRPVGRRAVYFPGSTIGNFEPAEALIFLRRTRQLCGQGGGFLVGVDLKKDVDLLERAYNDGQGVTREFNLNLLHRINRELHADFRPDRFRHHAIYNAEQGRIEMHLVSLEAQTVCMGEARIALTEGESIRTEYSYKYSIEEFTDLAAAAGFNLQQVWLDENRWFSVQFLTA